MSGDFASTELSARRDNTASLRDDLTFLRALNVHLATAFETDWPSLPSAPPTVFVIGLPRSGTTLLMQILCACLDVGFVDNLAARLWRTPITGIRFSRAVLGTRRDRTWSSDHGKTADPAGPHEFAYFWHWLLRMDGMPPYDPASERRRIDWDLVRRVLDNISATCGRPTIHKGMHAGYHIAAIAAALPDSGFVHLRRPALDVAASLAAARLHYYGSLDSWWSLYTPNFAHLRHEPWWRQIAAQVTWLERCHLQALSELPRQRVKTITYSALCADPLSVVSMVQALIADHCGVQVPQVGAAPASFAPSRPRIDAEMRDLLERGLAEIGSETEN